MPRVSCAAASADNADLDPLISGETSVVCSIPDNLTLVPKN